jgi:DNA-binding NarL/FixJ family response regulator
MTSPPGIEPSARVMIVEPVGVVRHSLRMLLAAEPDIEVLGESDDAERAFAITSDLKSHARAVVLVALELSGVNDAFWLIRSIRDRFPQMTIVATGTDLHRGSISQALFVGADGFIHKNSSPDRYVDAMRRAAAGELVLEGLPRGALGEIVEGLDRQRPTPSLLTEREIMVLGVASEGLTAREIGRRLGVRERTVTTHLNHIYRKLGANGRVSALSEAMRLGVLTVPEAERRSAIAVS